LAIFKILKWKKPEALSHVVNSWDEFWAIFFNFFLWKILFKKQVFFDEFFFFQNTFCKMGKTHHKKKFNDPLLRQGFLFLSYFLSPYLIGT
jgi:hypothetical protein